MRTLVNGASIAMLDPQAVTWCHLELDRHEIIAASDLLTESYLDTGNRAHFASPSTAARTGGRGGERAGI